MSGWDTDTLEARCESDALTHGAEALTAGGRSGRESVAVDGPQPRLLLTGGAVSTGNLGVSALGVASVKGILGALPAAQVVLQDWGGTRSVTVQLGERPVTLATTGLHYGSSLRNRAGTRHLSVLERVHRCVPAGLKRWVGYDNPVFAQLLETDAVLALCGGDSFSDIYAGSRAFKFMAALAPLLARMGKRLVLLPQTFGPFERPETRRAARDILAYASLVATREVDGERELASVFDGWRPENLVTCPDVAFTLDPVAVDPEREPFVLDGSDDRPLIGLNVSGLLYFSEDNFGVKDAYPRLIRMIGEWALSHPDRRLLLVPHVISRERPDVDASTGDAGRDVSDSLACLRVHRELSEGYGDRVGCLGWPYSEGETKYLIGRCVFMLGARMHSCIAGVSQGVPTVTLAYSKKARGVMGHLGDGAPVVDLRDNSHEAILEAIDQAYARRDELRAALADRLGDVRGRVESFFREQLGPAIANGWGGPSDQSTSSSCSCR